MAPRPTEILYRHDQAPVRLLELPPELLARIDAGDAPALSFKSAAGDLHDASTHIVLTTPDTTYQIRQVQTSNSVFLLQPGAADGHLEIASTVSSYLEAEALPTPCEPVPWLTRLLPVYSGPEDVDAALATAVTARAAVWADIPCSDGHIAEAWTFVVAFETAGQCFRPTDAVLADTWQACVTAAAAERVDLTGAVQPAVLWDGMAVEHPEPIFHAMLARLAKPRAAADISGSVTLDRAITVSWVGKVLLASLEGDVQQFVQTWRDALPEAWRPDASSEALAALQGHAKDGAESARVSVLVKKAAGGDGVAAASKSNVSGAKEAVQKRSGPQRNWHERFKKTKR